MTTFIAVFRGLNVGGSHKVPMADLRSMLGELGFGDVSTYIQSGNAVFRDGAGDAEAVAARIEAAFEKRFGFASATAVRTIDEWLAAMSACPFLDHAGEPKTVHIGFCRDRPDSRRVNELAAIESGRDAFALKGREIHLHVPDGLARSKLANALTSRNLGSPVTFRNWRTVETLAEMARQPA